MTAELLLKISASIYRKGNLNPRFLHPIKFLTITIPIVLGLFFVCHNAYATGTTQTQVFQISQGNDDVNENDTFDPGANPGWIGNANPTPPISILALRYNQVGIAQGSQITSAKLEVTVPYTHIHNISVDMYGENSGNSPSFSQTAKPSLRMRTLSTVNYTDDMTWQTGTWYSLGEIAPVIQEIINRSDWKSGNSLSMILVGVADHYNRKFINSYESSVAEVPRLTISFIPASTSSTPTPTCLNVSDVNCDGIVSFADAVLVIKKYGNSAVGNREDVSSDGKINIMDLVSVLGSL